MINPEFADVLINLRGHSRNPDEFVKLSTLDRYWSQNIETVLFLMSFRKKDPENEVLKEVGAGLSYINRCSVCNEPMYLEEVEEGKMAIRRPCLYPNGIPPFEVTLDCPSGQMIFGNDFRDLLPEKTGYDINAVLGTVMLVKAYEDVGMLHILVGNSCPSVFQKGDSELCISREYDEETDERKVPEGFDKEPVSWICTDLWWVSAMDYALFQKLCVEKGIKESDLTEGKLVEVKPGKWSFTFDPMKGCEFTTCFGRYIG